MMNIQSFNLKKRDNLKNRLRSHPHSSIRCIDPNQGASWPQRDAP